MGLRESAPFFVCGQSRQHVSAPSKPGTFRCGRAAKHSGVGPPRASAAASFAWWPRSRRLPSVPPPQPPLPPLPPPPRLPPPEAAAQFEHLAPPPLDLKRKGHSRGGQSGLGTEAEALETYQLTLPIHHWHQHRNNGHTPRWYLSQCINLPILARAKRQTPESNLASNSPLRLTEVAAAFRSATSCAKSWGATAAGSARPCSVGARDTAAA